MVNSPNYQASISSNAHHRNFPGAAYLRLLEVLVKLFVFSSGVFVDGLTLLHVRQLCGYGIRTAACEAQLDLCAKLISEHVTDQTLLSPASSQDLSRAVHGIQRLEVPASSDSLIDSWFRHPPRCWSYLVHSKKQDLC
jgi:hypothetical protein